MVRYVQPSYIYGMKQRPFGLFSVANGVYNNRVSEFGFLQRRIGGILPLVVCFISAGSGTLLFLLPCPLWFLFFFFITSGSVTNISSKR